MYTLYLPKIKGEDLSKRLVNKLLAKYSKWTNYENAIIASPGYLSTSTSSTNKFLSSIANLLSNNTNTEVGLLNGMNGAYPVRTISNISNRDNHINNFCSNNLSEIKLDSNTEIDHRKMICFFTRKSAFTSIITKASLNDFLNTISVNAILIGSSNQSNSTYFDPQAKKGEADIFMFKDTYWSPQSNKEITLSMLSPNSYQDAFPEFENSVLSISVYGKGNTNSELFLKDILKELLLAGLN